MGRKVLKTQDHRQVLKVPSLHPNQDHLQGQTDRLVHLRRKVR
jgi:hypothetical protein